MQMSKVLFSGSALALAAAVTPAYGGLLEAETNPVLQGSFHIGGGPDDVSGAAFEAGSTFGQAFVSPVGTRTAGVTVGGSTQSQGLISGAVSISSEESGSPTSIGTFTNDTVVNNVGESDGGDTLETVGLIVYDFDFSTLLDSVTVGAFEGQTGFALDGNLSVNFSQAEIFISFNGDGISLNETDIVAATDALGDVGGATIGAANFALVSDETQFRSLAVIPAADDPTDFEAIDLTEEFAEIAAGDGQFRIAISVTGFNADFSINDASGIFSFDGSGEVPEPGSLALLGLGSLAMVARRRC